MKKTVIFMISMISMFTFAAPTRVLVTDFVNESAGSRDALLGGTVKSEDLASRGAHALMKEMLDQPEVVLVDRREYLEQMEAQRNRDNQKDTPVKASVIHAAQSLGAEVVLRGTLLSFSTGKESINQGGFKTEFSTLSLRVSIQALDSVDGSLVAISDGVGQYKVRQTAAVNVTLGEDEVYALLTSAVEKAAPELSRKLEARKQRLADRPTVKLSIKTTEDPALVEIDGVLVGSTPLEGMTVYKGDHVLTIGKGGYPDVTKRVALNADTAIEVPMIRLQLDAEEMKDVLEKMRIHANIGEPAWVVRVIED